MGSIRRYYWFRLSALLEHINNPDETIASDRQNKLNHDLYALVAKERFIESNNALMNPPLPSIPADTLYCDQPQIYRVNYVKGTCNGFCYGYYTYPESNGGDFVWSPRTCDDQACCMVTNLFCIDRATGNLVHTEHVTSDGSSTSCGDDPLTLVECSTSLPQLDLETVWVLPCRPTCELNFLDLGGEEVIE
jgi:hypothetical protein